MRLSNWERSSRCTNDGVPGRILVASPREYSTLAVLAGLSVVFVILFRNNIPDDAFIYMRFAENVAAGKGWVFNPGENINAATSPIYTLILAATHTLGLTGRTNLHVAFGVGLLLAGGGLYLAMRCEGWRLAMVLAVFVMTWPTMLRSVGLETSFFMAFVVLAALAYQNENRIVAGIFAGLVTLSRPEGVAIVALLIFLDLVRFRRFSFGMVLAWTSVVLPWLIFCVVQFGTIVPHSAKIKSVQASIGWWSTKGPWFWAFIKEIPAFPVAFVLAPYGCFRAYKAFRAGRPFMLVFIGFGLIQAFGYTLLNAPAGYWWYYVPGGIAVTSAAIYGFRPFLCSIGRWMERSRSGFAEFLSATRAGSTTTYSLVTCVVIASYVAAIYVPLAGQANRTYRDSDSYRAVAGWLARNATTSDWVGANEIGYIGYYSGLNVRDMLGLLHLEAAAPLAAGKWDWWLAKQAAPQFVVMHNPPWSGEPTIENQRHLWPKHSYEKFRSGYRKVFQSGRIELYRHIVQKQQ